MYQSGVTCPSCEQRQPGPTWSDLALLPSLDLSIFHSTPWNLGFRHSGYHPATLWCLCTQDFLGKLPGDPLPRVSPCDLCFSSLSSQTPPKFYLSWEIFPSAQVWVGCVLVCSYSSQCLLCHCNTCLPLWEQKQCLVHRRRSVLINKSLGNKGMYQNYWGEVLCLLGTNTYWRPSPAPPIQQRILAGTAMQWVSDSVSWGCRSESKLCLLLGVVTECRSKTLFAQLWSRNHNTYQTELVWGARKAATAQVPISVNGWLGRSRPSVAIEACAQGDELVLSEARLTEQTW